MIIERGQVVWKSPAAWAEESLYKQLLITTYRSSDQTRSLLVPPEILPDPLSPKGVTKCKCSIPKPKAEISKPHLLHKWLDIPTNRYRSS